MNHNLPLVSGWRLGRWLRPRGWRRFCFWTWVRVRPGIFWYYYDGWGWLHLLEKQGGLCQLERAMDEARDSFLPLTVIASRDGHILYEWRFDRWEYVR